jgi:hypothetical protein
MKPETTRKSDDCPCNKEILLSNNSCSKKRKEAIS